MSNILWGFGVPMPTLPAVSIARRSAIAVASKTLNLLPSVPSTLNCQFRALLPRFSAAKLPAPEFSTLKTAGPPSWLNRRDAVASCTDNLLSGAFVPMPTLPSGMIRILSAPFVLTTTGWVSVVPKKSVFGLVLALPARFQSIWSSLRCHTCSPLHDDQVRCPGWHSSFPGTSWCPSRCAPQARQTEARRARPCPPATWPRDDRRCSGGGRRRGRSARCRATCLHRPRYARGCAYATHSVPQTVSASPQVGCESSDYSSDPTVLSHTHPR